MIFNFSGSVELTESKTVSIDYEKTNSLSSDEGMQASHGAISKKVPQNSPTKLKGTSPNTLVVQPLHSLGQSLPNLNINSAHSHSNTLLVPGTSSPKVNNNLLSPNHRGISYPPPSPTRLYLFVVLLHTSKVFNNVLFLQSNSKTWICIFLIDKKSTTFKIPKYYIAK